jgi:hypothetical protein
MEPSNMHMQTAIDGLQVTDFRLTLDQLGVEDGSQIGIWVMPKPRDY